MNLNKYKSLIQVMPILDQAFVIKSKNWEKQLKADHLELIFEGKSEITLNREDIITTNRIDLFLLKTILWGYPAGMRGTHFSSIYNRLDDLGAIINNPNRLHLNFKELAELQTNLRPFKGLGLSTYTKFLQLRGFRFDRNPALILDERIIRVFQSNIFEDFKDLSKISDYNKEQYYSSYLKCMCTCAGELSTSPEHLEMFLFTFGNNLKGTDTAVKYISESSF